MPANIFKRLPTMWYSLRRTDARRRKAEKVHRRTEHGRDFDLMFQGNPPEVKRGYFKEDELWDYKEEIPPANKGTESDWAGMAADVLAFHNRSGGVLIFGIRNSSFHFSGAVERIDTKLFNDKIRRYVGDRF